MTGLRKEDSLKAFMRRAAYETTSFPPSIFSSGGAISRRNEGVLQALTGLREQTYTFGHLEVLPRKARRLLHCSNVVVLK